MFIFCYVYTALTFVDSTTDLSIIAGSKPAITVGILEGVLGK